MEIPFSPPKKSTALCYYRLRNTCLALVTKLSRAQEQLEKAGANTNPNSHRAGLRPRSHLSKLTATGEQTYLLLQEKPASAFFGLIKWSSSALEMALRSSWKEKES